MQSQINRLHWWDTSIVGFILTSYHSLNGRIMFTDKHFTRFLQITCSYAQIRHWQNVLYIIVMLLYVLFIYFYVFLYLFIFTYFYLCYWFLFLLLYLTFLLFLSFYVVLKLNFKFSLFLCFTFLLLLSIHVLCFILTYVHYTYCSH
jgi:hypothetical protein